MIYKEMAIEHLRELSDYSFQRRVWLASSGPEVSSFTEAVCGLFDDTGLSDVLESPRRTIVFGPQIDERLDKLRQDIEPVLRLEEQLPPEALIESDKMKSIRRAAHEILSLIEKDETV